MPTDKHASSYRLSPEVVAAIDRLAALHGCSAASVISRGVLLLDRIESATEEAARKALAEMPIPPKVEGKKPRGRPRKPKSPPV